MSRVRKTRLQLHEVLDVIRERRVAGMTDRKILEELRKDDPTITDQRFYYWIQKMQERDASIMNLTNIKALESSLLVCKERLSESYDFYKSMADDETQEPSIRLKARELQNRITIDLV